MGCGAAIPNLEAAAGMLARSGEGPVLSLAVEICTATIFPSHEPELVVSNSIFGDGAAPPFSTCRGRVIRAVWRKWWILRAVFFPGTARICVTGRKVAACGSPEQAGAGYRRAHRDGGGVSAFKRGTASHGMTSPGGLSIRAARSCWPKSPRNWSLPARPCAFPTTSSRTTATCRHPPFCLSCGRSWTEAGHNPAKKGCSSRSVPASRPSRRSSNLRPLKLR